MVNKAPYWGLIFASLGLAIVLLLIKRKVKGGTKKYDIKYRKETEEQIKSRDDSFYTRSVEGVGSGIQESSNADGGTNQYAIDSGQSNQIQELGNNETPRNIKRTRRFIKRNKGIGSN